MDIRGLIIDTTTDLFKRTSRSNCFSNRFSVRREQSFRSTEMVMSKWTSRVRSGYLIRSAVSWCHKVKVKYRLREPAWQSTLRAVATTTTTTTTPTVSTRHLASANRSRSASDVRSADNSSASSCVISTKQPQMRMLAWGFSRRDFQSEG